MKQGGVDSPTPRAELSGDLGPAQAFQIQISCQGGHTGLHSLPPPRLQLVPRRLRARDGSLGRTLGLVEATDT